jgi:hypothetical protein
MTYQGVVRQVRVSSWQAVLGVVAGAVVALQLATLAQLAQAQVERGQARQDRVVAKLVSGDRCLDYKISAPRAECAPRPAEVVVGAGLVHLASTEPGLAQVR